MTNCFYSVFSYGKTVAEFEIIQFYLDISEAFNLPFVCFISLIIIKVTLYNSTVKILLIFVLKQYSGNVGI